MRTHRVIEWRRIPVDRGDVGVRLDLVLLRHLEHEPGMSRARIQKWIAAGRVLVNGTPAPRVAWRVAAGDQIDLDVREVRHRERPRPEDIPLDILFEDAHLLAIAKPAGLVVHPSYKHAKGTLINALLYHAERWPSGDAPALLTRLDKMTSGVVLVAKRREVVAALQREMRAERIDKDYLAVVWGKPVPARGTINLALDRDPWDRRRVTVTDRGGQPSVTKYERLAAAKLEKSLLEKTSTERGVPAEPLANSCSHAEAVAKAVSLLRCRLVTGRMHQIRVHLAHRGWPLVGDATYGLKNAPLAFPRQALHAWRVALTHPVTRERIDIEAPLPEDMQALLERLHLPAPAGERG